MAGRQNRLAAALVSPAYGARTLEAETAGSSRIRGCLGHMVNPRPCLRKKAFWCGANLGEAGTGRPRWLWDRKWAEPLGHSKLRDVAVRAGLRTSGSGLSMEWVPPAT